MLVTDENGCQNTDTLTVFVQNRIFIPNPFTPNGDGNNDNFKILGSGIQEIAFAVFDNSGNELFKTNDVTEVQNNG